MFPSTPAPDTPLPTLDRLGATVPDDLDVNKVAKEWFDAFSTAITSGNVESASNLFVSDAWWRDILALTWDLRTFSGFNTISQFLNDRLGVAKPHNFKLREDPYLGLQKPAPDLAWINFFFDFETDVGIASGIARLVPTADGQWKAHTVLTILEDLKGFPEKTGALRNLSPHHGQWEEGREKEVKFEGTDPAVIIVGGGHSALSLAARLKVLDVPTLIVEKNPRIGDSWRNRYASLTLHDPVWFDHMPYLPFPPTWPAYAPGYKLADWLESYAKTFELNTWTSSTVVKATQNESKTKWEVLVKRQDGTERVFNVNHLVFATGFGNTEVELPKYPGMDTFGGKILHTWQFKKGSDHEGKKVVVIGACTSAHDISVDCYESGVDVTMFQRSATCVHSTKALYEYGIKDLYSDNSPPIDISDRILASFPYFMNTGTLRRMTQAFTEYDKDILDGLRKVGFRLTTGPTGIGIYELIYSRVGGYYFDTGGSQLIADGKIKLKNDSQIEKFTETGLKFQNGSELPADVVIFATGIGDTRGQLKKVCGEAFTESCSPVFGLDAEGEINGLWRDMGARGLWFMMGSMMLSRFYSKHVALQIKAMEEGLFSGRYSLKKD